MCSGGQPSLEHLLDGILEDKFSNYFLKPIQNIQFNNLDGIFLDSVKRKIPKENS